MYFPHLSVLEAVCLIQLLGILSRYYSHGESCLGEYINVDVARMANCYWPLVIRAPTAYAAYIAYSPCYLPNLSSRVLAKLFWRRVWFRRWGNFVLKVGNNAVRLIVYLLHKFRCAYHRHSMEFLKSYLCIFVPMMSYRRNSSLSKSHINPSVNTEIKW